MCRQHPKPWLTHAPPAGLAQAGDVFLGLVSYETDTLELALLLHRQMQSQRACVPVGERGGGAWAVAAAVVVGEDAVGDFVFSPVLVLAHSAQSVTV